MIWEVSWLRENLSWKISIRKIYLFQHPVCKMAPFLWIFCSCGLRLFGLENSNKFAWNLWLFINFRVNSGCEIVFITKIWSNYAMTWFCYPECHFDECRCLRSYSMGLFPTKELHNLFIVKLLRRICA